MLKPVYLKQRKRRAADGGEIIAVTAQGFAEDWKTLSGLTARVDPRLLRRTHDRHGRDLVALDAALIAAATAGKKTVPAGALADACGIARGDLRAQLARLARDTGRVEARLEGRTVHVGKAILAVTRQDLYEDIAVADVASAPSAQHLWAWMLVAAAKRSVRPKRPELRGHTVPMPTEDVRVWLQLAPGADVAATLEEVRGWVEARLGRPFSVRLVRGEVLVSAPPQVANRDLLALGPEGGWSAGYLGADMASFGIRDGVVRGVDLTVRPARPAKTWAWCKARHNVLAPGRVIRALWLSAVGAWVTGQPTGLPFWPVERLQALLPAVGATETCCRFLVALAEASRRPGGVPSGPRWRVDESLWRDLEEARRSRAPAPARKGASTKAKPRRAPVDGEPTVARRGRTRLTAAALDLRMVELAETLRSGGASEAQVAEALRRERGRWGIRPPTYQLGAEPMIPVADRAAAMPRLTAARHAAAVPAAVAGSGMPEAARPPVEAMAVELARLTARASREAFLEATQAVEDREHVIGALALETLRRATGEDSALAGRFDARQREFERACPGIPLEMFGRIVAEAVRVAWLMAVEGDRVAALRAA